MGSGASSLPTNVEVGGKSSVPANVSINTNTKPPLPKHMPSSRVAQSSRMSSNVSSVRRMALLNHSRQENTYMSQDVLSANFVKKTRKFKPRKAETVLEPAATPVSDSPPDTGDVPSTGGPNFNFLKHSLKLKINVEDDADWVQVSDDEADNEVDLGTFNMGLISLPEESVSPPGAAPSGSDKEVKPSFVDNGTMFVDGIKVGISNNGIIRADAVTGDMPRHNNKLPMRERLIVLCKLGQGASSVVYKALDLNVMRLVALKMIHVNDKDKRVQMVRELCALYQLLKDNSRRMSANMSTIIGKNVKPEKYIVGFHDAFSNLEDGVVSLMIEYMDGGSLEDIVEQGGCSDEPTLANIAVQALKGLAFLHGCGQIHRDLKPGNFLISHRGEVKVADLGIMKQLSVKQGGSALLPKTNTFVGTATYMSPERIDGKEYSFPSDVWAFGLSLVTLALGKLPIDTAGGYWTILHNIRDAPPPSLPADMFSEECRDFVSRCLKRNPEERATCAELLKHPFLNKVVAEDMTYDQNHDRGKRELQSIILSIFAHIKLMQDNALEACANVTECDECYTNHRLFGNLITSSPLDILRKLLFGEDRQQSLRRPANDHRFSRPKLINLAKQLHLPIDKVEHEAKLYFEVLKAEYGQEDD